MNPTDVVDGSYELISFAAGGEPAWPDFRSLFTDPCVPGLRVFPDDAAITVMNLDAYMVHQMREGLSDEGYSESPGKRSTTIVVLRQEHRRHCHGGADHQAGEQAIGAGLEGLQGVRGGPGLRPSPAGGSRTARAGGS